MDISSILSKNSIPFVEEGNNVKRGHINIKCPWCGDADPSQHLGIELKTGRWACWRNTLHRGRNLQNLLMKLLGCSYDAANEMVGESRSWRESLGRLTVDVDVADVEPAEREKPLFPGLDDLDKHRRTRTSPYNRFWNYLESRGYNFTDASIIACRYNLKCALTGPFKNRIVFPITADQDVAGYVGRCIDGGSLRYLSLPGPAVKNNILWFDSVACGGRRLYICEGPFDALRIDFACASQSVPDRATCLFGTSATHGQISRLFSLRCRFDEFVVLLDRDALSGATSLRAELSVLGARAVVLPPGAKDPDGLTLPQMRRLVT
ncbi:MAG: hypothetical protein WC378_00300 [Opitutaceae bacterium]|jgi:hypothetical protein